MAQSGGNKMNLSALVVSVALLNVAKRLLAVPTDWVNGDPVLATCASAQSPPAELALVWHAVAHLLSANAVFPRRTLSTTFYTVCLGWIEMFLSSPVK